MGSARENRPDVSLTPSGIGQYINYSGCPRYFRLKYFDQAIVKERNWYDSNTHSGLFAEIGLSFEDTQLETLADQASVVVGDEAEDGDPVSFDEIWAASVGLQDGSKSEAPGHRWEQTVRNHFEECVEEAAALDTDDDPVVLFQLPITGQIGVWDITGLADLITLEPTEGGVRSRVLEVKTAWKDKTAHQIQATIYSLLIDEVITDLGFKHEPVAAVVNREADLRETPLDELDYIDRDSRTAEVKRLLKRDGELHDLSRQSFEEVGYRLERKCDGCPYNGICFTKAIESADPPLLNLTQGDQRRLDSHGIDRIHELSALYEADSDKRPIDYDGLEIEDEDVVRTLETEGRLGDRLEEIVQRAQMLREELDPEYDQFDDVQYLKGSGNGSLPDDDPHPALDVPYERGTLLRVYLYVQEDHIRNRLALLAGRINGNRIEPREIVEMSEGLAAEQQESRDEESGLLERFFESLFETLHDAAKGAGFGDEARVHLYFYSRNERDALMDAVQRQQSTFGSQAVRDLLGLREGIDQRMVSVVHDDVTKRLALRYPGTGLVQTVEQLGAFAGDEKHDKWYWNNDEWVVERKSEELDLRSVFRTGMFERWRPYALEDDSVRLLLGDQDEEPDGWYPLYNRYSNQIPLEYVWAANGKLDEVVQAASNYHLHTFAPYRYRDGAGSGRIEPGDISALALKLCEALEHVERSIGYKNFRMSKHPISLPDLPDFGLPDANLGEACQEYLDLEYATRRQECLDHYLDPPRQRVQSGEATMFRVTDVVDDGRYDIRVSGELLYEELYDDPAHVLDSCRIKGGEGNGSGSWRVMTKLQRDGSGGFEHVGATSPENIEHSAKATVQRFDRQNHRIVVTASKMGGFGNGRFLEWHCDATLDPEDAEKFDTVIEEGDLFILDPYADSYPSNRAYNALEHTDSNALYDLLDAAFSDGQVNQFHRKFCSQEHIKAFLDRYKQHTGEEPLGQQKRFVTEVDHAVSVLQGPPGTGKTSYTLAPAVLARLWAAEQEGRRLVTVVTAPSHTAVDEAMEDIADRWKAFHDTTDELDESSFVRVLSGERTETDYANVEYRNYYDTDDVARVAELLAPHLTDEVDTQPEHLVLFTTTTSLRGVVDKVASRVFGLDGAEDVMAAGGSFIDLLAIDEASMLNLPQTLLASAYLEEDSQTLLIGDHRQMEPVQQHDWDGEDRRTIEENVPFMSALNFVRFLRGDLDEVEYAVPSSPEVGDAIPITRLDKTYRLHNLVANLLTDLVYTDDGIRLRSDQEELLPPVNSVTEGIDAAMESECPVTLVLHDEAESQDANRTEVALVQAMLQALDESAGDIGVVTPHNAQKGRLVESIGNRVTADTVERFQGGERDVMFISATASDPDYVREEAEFLLNPNRLNVAMSRMKKKLVIVASESVFRVTPSDADEFDQTLIWKRLYDAMGVTDEEPETLSWRGSIREFCPTTASVPPEAESTSLSVYTLRVQQD
jgi:hypothetical protein